MSKSFCEGGVVSEASLAGNYLLSFLLLNTIGEYMNLLHQPPASMTVRPMEFVVDGDGNGSFRGDRNTIQVDWDGIDAPPTFNTSK